MNLKFRYKNIVLHKDKEENPDRKEELIEETLSKTTFIPDTVVYKDIDEAFTKWAKELEIIDDDGKQFPTFPLFSNQRFSEYSHTWKHVDENNNILLNFKSVTRDNNPEYGKIQSGLWNIPGDRYYTVAKKKVLDDNGTESYLRIAMKQPTQINFNFKLNIFTTKYQKLNEFNTLLNKTFNACQCYIAPNGHYMPMKLDRISDESQYNIDDRQYYSQVYTISVLGYIITEEDYKVEELPLKIGFNYNMIIRKKKAEVEIEEPEELKNPYYYKPLILTIKYDECGNFAEFNIDTDFFVCVHETTHKLNIVKENLYGTILWINGEYINGWEDKEKLTFKDGDRIKIKANKIYADRPSKLIIYGYDENIVYDEKLDIKEVDIDETQYIEKIEVEADDKCSPTKKEKDYSY